MATKCECGHGKRTHENGWEGCRAYPKAVPCPCTRYLPVGTGHATVNSMDSKQNAKEQTMKTEETCPTHINPTDRFEMYSPARVCGRPIKANGRCGIHNPDRPVNPWFVAKNIRRHVGASLGSLAKALATPQEA